MAGWGAAWNNFLRNYFQNRRLFSETAVFRFKHLHEKSFLAVSRPIGPHGAWKGVRKREKPLERFQ